MAEMDNEILVVVTFVELVITGFFLFGIRSIKPIPITTIEIFEKYR